MEISKKMIGTVTNKWANTNIVWESNPDLVEFLYKLIVQTKEEQVVVRILKDDFNKVEIGDTVEIVEKKELSPFTRCNFPYYEFVRKVEKVEGKPNMGKKSMWESIGIYLIEILLFMIVSIMLALFGNEHSNKALLVSIIFIQMLSVSMFLRTGDIRNKQDELKEEIKRLKDKLDGGKDV